MKIALLHNHYDKEHLAAVEKEMKKLGPPIIRVLDLGFDNLVQALEGTHRLRAAEKLGFTPILEYVEPHQTINKLDLDTDSDPNECVDTLGDYENYTVTIQDGEIVPNKAEYLSVEEMRVVLINNDWNEADVNEMADWELYDAVNDED